MAVKGSCKLKGDPNGLCVSNTFAIDELQIFRSLGQNGSSSVKMLKGRVGSRGKAPGWGSGGKFFKHLFQIQVLVIVMLEKHGYVITFLLPLTYIFIAFSVLNLMILLSLCSLIKNCSSYLKIARHIYSIFSLKFVICIALLSIINFKIIWKTVLSLNEDIFGKENRSLSK